MLPFVKGCYSVRQAITARDIDRLHRLRHFCFITHRGLVTQTCDHDAYDQHCQHILIEHTLSATAVCCFRLMPFASGKSIGASYSAQFYDLAKLSALAATKAELGRFCVHPDWSDPDILRVAWGALAAMVRAAGVEMLFGCTSFDGADPADHTQALLLLKDAHLAPDYVRPGIKSPAAYPFASVLWDQHPDQKRALRAMPPLLRMYLKMGGWVSDHAVRDLRLNTLHVFTGVNVNAIGAGRTHAMHRLASA